MTRVDPIDDLAAKFRLPLALMQEIDHNGLSDFLTPLRQRPKR